MTDCTLIIKSVKSDHEKGNLQLTFDRNTIHSESFGLNWTMKKKWTGSMTSPLRTVSLSSDNDQGTYPSFSMPHTPRIQIITSFTLILPLLLYVGEGFFLGKIF